ncbi:MAG: dockerin type I domain-containing protein [Breznakia sp.]
MKIKKQYLMLMVLTLLLSFFVVDRIQANDDSQTETDNNTTEVGATLPEDHVFTTMNANGEIVEMDMSALEKQTQQEMRAAKRLRFSSTRAPKNGVVNFKTKSSSGYNTNYTEDGTNRSGYLNGYYGADGAFLGYNSNGSKVKFMQAGVIGWVNTSEVQILDYDNYAQVKSINFYRSDNGILNHYGTNNLSSSYYFMTNQVGVKQSYMNNNEVYYSYDGHYFYKTYAQMIADYKAGHRKNSINPNNPYYNYYQYITHRTKTSFTAAQLNSYVASISNTNSKMYNQGNAFVSNQNIYGVNAALSYGVAANESAWGQSSIAQTKNNLFGHAAYDSDPNASNGYSSPAFSIFYHAKRFVSIDYLDPKDYSGRYYGGHLGDKASGMNVKYASDPYWGEKAATVSWHLQKKYNVQDTQKYTLAIKAKGVNLNIRKDPNTASSAPYQTGASGDYPFVVLEKVIGESIDGNNIWYKIQSDPTLNGDRSQITQDIGNYDYAKFYGYVHASYVSLVANSENINDPVPEPIAGKGDVNGDQKISAVDYVLVKNHILEIKALSSQQQSSGDMNGDHKISAVDYVLIKNHILNQ